MTVSVPPAFAETGLHCIARGSELRRFIVIGERSSGTNYVNRLLARNVPLTPTDAFGWKHGHPQMLAVPPDLVVVVAVRRADDWARSMFAKPWHTRPDMQRLPFSEFLRAPWDTIIDRLRYFEAHAPELALGEPLQLDRDVATGQCYANLFALRRGKLASHLTYLNRDCNMCLVRMEDAVSDPGRFLSGFLVGFGLPPLADAPRLVMKRLGARFQPAAADRPALPEALSGADLAFLRAECDLDLEARLGYRYEPGGPTVSG